jgi:hypothetical protein
MDTMRHSMSDNEPFTTFKDLYESIKGEDSITYRAFMRKLHRMMRGSHATQRHVYETLGIPQPSKRSYKKSPNVFVAYDGEGWNDKYVLLANSLGERIVNRDGLSTDECLAFLTRQYDQTKRRIFFAFSYDVNHILHDVPDRDLLSLVKGNTIHYHDYTIRYISGKILSIDNYRYYDIFGFFQKSFIATVEQMLGADRISDGLRSGKAARGTFEEWDLDAIIRYNDEELQLMVEVAQKLDSALEEIGVHLTQWYGPGAIAQYWYRKHVDPPNEHYSPEAYTALAAAYYGGRFEQLVLGTVQHVYEYDIHSAYPSVIAEMPYFLDWKRTKRYQPDNPYSVWHIAFDFRRIARDSPTSGENLFLPFPMRAADGRISFPLMGSGWYWQREVDAALRYFPSECITIHRGFVATTGDRPFGWVKELYDYRLALKDANNQAEYAIKVGLNSLYGKMAQRVSRNRYFSIAWAGYVTSSTRAKLVEAGCAHDREHVLGFATDAIFTTVPLQLPISTALGDWEESSFSSATFFQSGVYRLRRTDGTSVDRYRGSPLRRGIDDIISQLHTSPNDYSVVKIGRFISHLLALKAPQAYGPYRLQFINSAHRLIFDAPYKRFYLFPNTIRKGKAIKHYDAMLKQPIPSLPKVTMSDVSEDDWLDRVYGAIRVHVDESYPQVAVDRIEQSLLAEGIISAVYDGEYEDVSQLEKLPVVEDTTL